LEEVIYGISHDLRGPLLNLAGFLRRLRKACEGLETQSEQWTLTVEQRAELAQLLEQKVWGSVEVLERNAQRMNRLVEALLELSRAGREPPQFEKVATGDVVAALADELAPLAKQTRAALRIEPLPELWGDRARVEAIFRRLLSNAFKFLDPERAGDVRVGGSSNGAGAVCWVRDNGIGIGPQHQERIFLPFGRVRQIEAPGEGVGLAIARKLVSQMGGRLWVDSAPGEGSSFYFSLPKSQ
jgi:signal transduction histidine kinase